jgi:23S rRNA pseudouridine1911/1915/1917 synthase
MRFPLHRYHARAVAEARELRVGEEFAGERLDRFLAGALGLSRGYVRRLLSLGLVHLAGAAVVKGGLLRAGDVLQIDAFRHPDEGPLAAADLELPVLLRQGELVAFDKPAGMPSHPLDYESADTALNAALARFPELAGVGEGGLEPGLVHRLDTGTSGVLLFALTDDAWRAAREAFRSRRVEKRYRARVHGARLETGPLGVRLTHRGARMRVVARGGRQGLLEVLRAVPDGETTLLEIELITGLMHQIRASLAHLGHPIVGDRLYGSTVECGRHWLHACSLRLGSFEAHSEPPPELRF